MKVLHVISTVNTMSGGPASVLFGLMDQFIDSEHEFCICCTNSGFSSIDREKWISLVASSGGRISLKLFDVNFDSLLFSQGMRAWLVRHIEDYDLVHVHGLYRFPPSFAAHLARKLGLPYIIRPHGNLDPYLYRQSTRSVWMKRLYERWFDLPNLNAASAIHYTAQDERERAAFLNLRAPSFIIPNGLAWGRYAELPERGAFRRSLGIGDVPLVLFLGRLNFKKGLDLLIPAFSRVREIHPYSHLAIVGPDNEGYGLRVNHWVQEHALQDFVHFVESISGDAVTQAYVDADVFVLPSYTENFGMTVAESLACGTPVVISDQVNIYHEVSEVGAGLVTRCNVGEVAEALSVLLGDPGRRDAMGDAGRALVQRKWTWDVVVRDLMAEYEKVIERHGCGKLADA